MDYWTPLDTLRAQLTTADRPAVLDRALINPPCVFIALRGFDQWTVCGATEAAVHLYLCVGDRGDEGALLALSPLLDDLLEQLDALGMPVEAIEADQLLTTDTTTPYPAFRIETHLSI